MVLSTNQVFNLWNFENCLVSEHCLSLQFFSQLFFFTLTFVIKFFFKYLFFFHTKCFDFVTNRLTEFYLESSFKYSDIIENRSNKNSLPSCTEERNNQFQSTGQPHLLLFLNHVHFTLSDCNIKLEKKRTNVETNKIVVFIRPQSFQTHVQAK